MTDVAGPEVSTEVPGRRSRELLGRLDRTMYPGFRHDLAPFVMARKHDFVIEDVDGNVFWDFVSASASVPFGAAPEAITDAAIDAMRRYGLEDTHAIVTDLVASLADELLSVAPAGLTRIDIALNGTEAVETALRFMRRATGRQIVIGFMGGYHGEAGTAGAAGAEAAELSSGYRALMPGFAHVPYPNEYRTPFRPRPGGTGDGTIDYLRDHVLFHEIDPREVAGVVIEPVLGSGGCVAPPVAFWPALADLCREHGWLLCADEVKTGFGRSGALFAVERWGVRPDLVALGKAMGGGVLPIGAVLGTEEAIGFDDLSTGSTWSWFPGGCAAALETLRTFREEPILENVRALEAIALGELPAMKSRHSSIGDVRAVGCFWAIEFVRDRETKERDVAMQQRVEEEAMKRGVLGTASTTSYNLQPSLVTPTDVAHRALAIVDDAISAAEGAMRG